MSTTCQLTGTRPSFGNNVSHSQRKTRRRWNPNLQTKTYWVPSLGRRVTVRLSTRAIKIIDKRGIDTVAAQLLKRGK